MGWGPVRHFLEPFLPSFAESCRLIKQEDLGVDFANETSFPTLRSSMEASPRGSPSHIGDGLSEYMDRRRYRDETPTPTPTPAPAPNSF